MLWIEVDKVGAFCTGHCQLTVMSSKVMLGN